MLDIGYSSRYQNKAKAIAKKIVPGFLSERIFEVTGLRNNLIQIGTGEGKSVTLAVTAAVLSLLGFDVYCVCYSEYLSKRDFAAFKPLFDKLNLLEFIHYGTFNQICEDTINRVGDVRQIVEKIINNNEININPGKIEIKRPRILLIDEVDVFFSKDFYGNHYQPCLSLIEPSIVKLIKFVWSQRKDITLNKVRSSQEYKDCCDRYPDWKDLVHETLKDMVSDLKSFENHDYIVKDDKIGYKEQDGVVFDTRYGYKTLFAYLLENENGKISNESLNENVSLLVKLGTFSYAEIPNDNFYSILGVTGKFFKELLLNYTKKIGKKLFL